MTVLFCARPEQPDALPEASASHFADVLNARIPEHRGAVALAEDGLVVALFEDAAEAVNCAIDVQERLARYDSQHSGTESLRARVGIHFGETSLSEGICNGTGVDVVRELLPIVPPSRIFLTRDVFVRVCLLLPLKFESVGKKVFSGPAGEKDLFSVAWESVTANLEASLKRLGEDDLQRAVTLSSKLGLDSSKKASFLVLIFFVLFLFVLLKALKVI